MVIAGVNLVTIRQRSEAEKASPATSGLQLTHRKGYSCPSAFSNHAGSKK